MRGRNQISSTKADGTDPVVENLFPQLLNRDPLRWGLATIEGRLIPVWVRASDSDESIRSDTSRLQLLNVVKRKRSHPEMKMPVISSGGVAQMVEGE
jgi:hypothetical protein